MLGKERRMTPPPRLTLLRGDRLVNAVGESHYQDALREVSGAGGGEEVRFPCTAVLASEPDNPFDPNAVAVRVDGRLVAYLSRADAVGYRPLVLDIEERGRAAACEAMIAGRGAASGTSNLGVFLRLPRPEAG
jgi:hypothetical protein